MSDEQIKKINEKLQSIHLLISEDLKKEIKNILSIKEIIKNELDEINFLLESYNYPFSNYVDYPEICPCSAYFYSKD